MGKNKPRVKYVRVFARRLNGEVAFSRVMSLKMFRTLQERYPDSYNGRDYVTATYDEWAEEY